MRRSAADVVVTNPDKLMYPAAGFTKAQVVEYYVAVSPYLLPHLENRPVTLKRYPDGVGGHFFYEKDAPTFTPKWVTTFPVPRRHGGPPIKYIVINDRRTLGNHLRHARFVALREDTDPREVIRERAA